MVINIKCACVCAYVCVFVCMCVRECVCMYVCACVCLTIAAVVLSSDQNRTGSKFKQNVIYQPISRLISKICYKSF